MPNLGNHEVFVTNMKIQSHTPKNQCYVLCVGNLT